MQGVPQVLEVPANVREALEMDPSRKPNLTFLPQVEKAMVESSLEEKGYLPTATLPKYDMGA